MSLKLIRDEPIGEMDLKHEIERVNNQLWQYNGRSKSTLKNDNCLSEFHSQRKDFRDKLDGYHRWSH